MEPRKLLKMYWQAELHMQRRQKFRNQGSKLLLIFTEPEARDFWLEPGEEVEIRGTISSDQGMFEIDLHEDGFTIWPSNEMGCISVWQNDLELQCGHKRPPGWGS
jgi:hypothetical protein